MDEQRTIQETVFAFLPTGKVLMLQAMAAFSVIVITHMPHPVLRAGRNRDERLHSVSPP